MSSSSFSSMNVLLPELWVCSCLSLDLN
jgi:hypothetical protein